LKFNDEVYALGNLNKVGVSLTKGVISNPKINVDYNGNTREVIQSDLVIAEGNSGGALVDDEGKLIGITTFRLKDGSNDTIYGICYSIPVNIVVEYIK
jgi:S1-C subfamily serine protease